MVDVTIVGGGSRVRSCGEVLARAGFNLVHSFSIETGDRSPIILGEMPGAFQVAREAVASGRHILIAGSQVLTPERLDTLMENRRQAQALFIWHERRFHPGYKLLNGLIETDNTWRPRYLRQETLATEPTTSPGLRWLALEAVALMETLVTEDPHTVTAAAVHNPKRNAPDLLNLTLSHRDVEAHLIAGMGEAIERRETLVASDTRKAFIDELNTTTPLRIIDDEPTELHAPRWRTYAAPSPAELARLQCVAFLDATLDAGLTQHEAALWLSALGVLEATEQSIASRATADVNIKREDHRFRLISGFDTNPPSVA